MLKFGNVSVSFIAKLEGMTRKLLSKMSVEVVRKFASEVGIEQELLGDDAIYIHNSRHCLPMFWTYKVLLKIGASYQIPLLLRATVAVYEERVLKPIDQAQFFYVSQGVFPKKYRYTSFIETVQNTPICVFKGISVQKSSENYNREELRKKLLKFSVEEIILSGAADPSPISK